MIPDFKSVTARHKLDMTNLHTVKKHRINLRTAIVTVTADQVLNRISGIADRFKHFIWQKTAVVVVKRIEMNTLRHRNIERNNRQPL